MATVDPQNTRVLSCIKDLWSLSCGLYQAEISKYACELRFYCLNISFWKWFAAAFARCAGCDMNVCVWPYKRSEIWLSLVGKNVGVPVKQHDDAKKSIKVGQPWISIITWELFFMTCYVAHPSVLAGLVSSQGWRGGKFSEHHKDGDSHNFAEIENSKLQKKNINIFDVV